MKIPAIRERRSVRRFTKDKVSQKDIEDMIEAGIWAPSGLNNQPWKFKVLIRQEKNKIAIYTKYGKIIEEAPACIAVFLDNEKSYNRDKDLQAIGACIQNMLLEIHAKGFGGVWLGEILNQKTEVQQVLGIKNELMAVIAFGKPSEPPKKGQRLPKEEFILQ